EWERRLCAGHVMPLLLQHWRAHLSSPDPFDRLFTIIHGSHFAFFLIFGLAVWLLRPNGFARYALAVVLVLYVGLALYALVPTVPPWMAAERFGVLPPIDHIVNSMYNTNLFALQEAFDVNPVAAMPSLHAALPALCMLIAFYEFGWWGLPVAAYTGLALFGVM